MQIKKRQKALKPEPKIDSALNAPDTVIDTKDPGDDVLRRFRFQITFAGILCLLMVDDETYQELYCEQHEDILLKHKDGTFSGIQVKTKDLDLPPFNIEDEAIIKSFKRFIGLEQSFPNKFTNFSIVSNHGFDKSKPNLCINTLIENIKKGTDVLKARSKTLMLVKKLVADTGCSDDLALQVISKTRIKSYSDLDGLEIKLVNDLRSCSILRGATESKLLQIADQIIVKCFKASSLFNSDGATLLNYISGKVGIEEVAKQCINDKRITREDLLTWLKSEKGNPVVLLLKDRHNDQQTTDGHRLLEIKMDAGGIDSENITSVKDFKYAFEQHAASWLYKDPEEAESRYTQVMAVTQNICKEVYDEKQVDKNQSSGQEMLVAVRNEIKDRKKTEPKIFLDCSYEHVIGAVGVLTEACKVWWTPKFEIKE